MTLTMLHKIEPAKGSNIALQTFCTRCTVFGNGKLSSLHSAIKNEGALCLFSGDVLGCSWA